MTSPEKGQGQEVSMIRILLQLNKVHYDVLKRFAIWPESTAHMEFAAL